MEKLILRGVMYGADKIPDHWFEKVPGNFYKPKDNEQRGDRKKQQQQHHQSRSSDHHHHHRRRYSTGSSSRGRASNMDRDRSQGDRRRHDHRGRSSYDGGEDEQYSDDDRRRRRRHGADTRQERSHHDEDRYGRRDGHDSPPRDDFRDDRRDRRRESPPRDADDMRDDMRGSGNARNVNGWQTQPVSVAGGVATGGDGRSQNDSPSNPLPQVYVPYAHIYGGPKSTPPASTTDSVQPNAHNRMTHGVAPLKYQQNVDAQQAPTAAAAGAGAEYNGQPGWIYPEDPRWDPRYAHDRGKADHKSSSRPTSSSQRSGQEDDSPTDNGSNTYEKRSRRSDRDDDRSQRAKSHGGRGKSKIREMFDPSQRGLGYSAVGALAGGLVGSEVGKGIVPIGLGVAVGALGANAFEARERYVNANDHDDDHHSDPRKPSHGAHSSQHRGAAPSASRSRREEKERPEPPPPRRKDDKRHSQWTEDGTYARRNAQHRDSWDRNGHYSD